MDQAVYRAAVKQDLTDVATEARAVLSRTPLLAKLPFYAFEHVARLARIAQHQCGDKVMTMGRCPLSIFCSRGTPPSIT